MSGTKSALMFHKNNEEDPYITERDRMAEVPDEDLEDYTIKSTDMVVVASRAEEGPSVPSASLREAGRRRRRPPARPRRLRATSRRVR